MIAILTGVRWYLIVLFLFFLKKIFLILQYSILNSTVVKYNNWPTGAGIKWIGKKSYLLEEGVEVKDVRAEG